MLKRLLQVFTKELKLDIPMPNSFNTELIRTLPENENSVSARDLLKEATQLKKEKKFNEACKKLEEAYSAKDAGDLTIKEELRLPMYLQLAGRSDEGWKILNELSIKYIDVFSQTELANQMKIFLQKENKFKQAILFSIWAICREIERDRDNMKSCIILADDEAKMNAEFKLFTKLDIDKGDEEVVGTTPKGNPITDKSYTMFKERIESSMSINGIINQLALDLKKAELENKSNELGKSISRYLNSKKHYNLVEVRDLISKKLN